MTDKRERETERKKMFPSSIAESRGREKRARLQREVFTKVSAQLAIFLSSPIRILIKNRMYLNCDRGLAERDKRMNG